MKNSFFSLLASLIICQLTVCSADAQTKIDINNGPVKAFSKNNGKPSERLGKTRLFLYESVWLKKGDWLVAKAGSRSKPVSIDVYDRVTKKYVKTDEDTLKHPLNTFHYRSELTFQANRSDTFDVLLSVNYNVDLIELGQRESQSYGFLTGSVDTALVDYTIAVLNSQWEPKDTNWSFQQRLSYICNNWTAGFSAIPKVYNKEEFEKSKKVVAYYPVDPIAIDDRLNVSLQVLSNGSTLVYFMYTNDEPFAQAKKMYDELFAKLKAATDKASVSNLSKLRRVNELETSYFQLKIPADKRPFEYLSFFGNEKESQYLPINLFLFGTKQKAKVLVVIGEPDSDIYDIEW